MLAPHHRENAQFGEVGRAAQDLLDALELLGQQPQFLSGFYGGKGGDLRLLHDDALWVEYGAAKVTSALGRLLWSY